MDYLEQYTGKTETIGLSFQPQITVADRLVSMDYEDASESETEPGYKEMVLELRYRLHRKWGGHYALILETMDGRFVGWLDHYTSPLWRVLAHLRFLVPGVRDAFYDREKSE